MFSLKAINLETIFWLVGLINCNTHKNYVKIREIKETFLLGNLSKQLGAIHKLRRQDFGEF